MKLIAVALTAAVASPASAAFVGYYTVKTETRSSGVAIDVYVLYARFDGGTDTVFSTYDFKRIDGSLTNFFYHKDQADSNDGVLMKEFGSWNPRWTGSPTLNRPFDSFLTIGGNASGINSTDADPSWGDASWDRPDVPNGANVGWFNSNPSNQQGRVGTPGNLIDSVRLGQFVIDSGRHRGIWNLKIAYSSGVDGSPVQFAESTFALPAPGAMALLGLAGLAGRRRR